MRQVIVVDEPRYWPLALRDVQVIASRDYLTDPAWSTDDRVRVFNLCRSHRYQRLGYYVSLLAEARGHRPMPSIATIQDLKSVSIIAMVGNEIDELIQDRLRHLRAEKFELSVYFGRNVAKHYEELAEQLFRRFRAPLLRAFFAWSAKGERWLLQNVNAIGVKDVPEEHHVFFVQTAQEYFSTRRRLLPVRATGGYDLAILCNPREPEPPSNERALRRFERAANAEGLNSERIGKDDYDRLAEFDALFIRETTAVNHHTFRFSRKAQAEGLVVVDDPVSIVRCTNKVYLAEALAQHKLPMPRTMIVHRGNVEQVEATLSLPCVLKQPDSAFSQGVRKVETREQLVQVVEELLESSQLVVGQEFLPTEFDWRIGVLDRQPIYACRYFMAERHWQIIQRRGDGSPNYGNAQTLPVEMAPTRVVKTAVRAANLMGDGLYGVDLKQVGDKVYVIEVNDNPSLDAGVEDAVLKDELYRMVMRVFLARIERNKTKRAT